GLQQPDGAAREIDLDAFSLVEPPDMQFDPALRHAELHHLLVELDDVYLGVAGKADRLGADAKLGARLRIGPERAAGPDRVIDRSRRPLRFAGEVKGKFALHKTDSTDAGGRLFLAECRGCRKQGCGQKRGGESVHTVPRNLRCRYNGGIVARLWRSARPL